MKTLYMTLLLMNIHFSDCAAQTDATDSKETWVGHTSVTNIANHFKWYNDNYATYLPDSSAIRQLQALVGGYTFYIVGGVWCGDTKRNLPRFYKVLNMANVSADNISLYLLDKSKHSPQKQEKRFKVDYVPTLLVFKNNKEVGRIEEKPHVSIEEDLLSIIRIKK